MFGLKNMGLVASLMSRQGELKAAAEDLARRVETLRIEGSSGGGACRVVVSGKQRVESVTLSPALASSLAGPGSAREQAQSLIAEATNDALRNCQDRIRAMVEDEARRLGLEDLIPKGEGGFGPLGKLLG